MDGIGRSSIVREMGAFFVFLVVMCIARAATRVGHYLRSANLLLLLAAVFQTTAWALHGTEFATISYSASITLTRDLYNEPVQFLGQLNLTG